MHTFNRDFITVILILLCVSAPLRETLSVELLPLEKADFTGDFVMAIDCNGTRSTMGDASFLPSDAIARTEGRNFTGEAGGSGPRKNRPDFLTSFLSNPLKPTRLSADASTCARDLVPGERYRLQLIFGGNLPGKNERRTAIEVEGETVATDLLLGALEEPSVFVHTFTATDPTLDLALVSTAGSAYLHALTVEALAPAGMGGKVGVPQDEIVRPDLDPKQHPNILFIAIDDMNDWVGCLGGHPDAWTPNIDRLAKRGTLFTNGHTAAPVCNPSRAAFLSGLGPWRSGVYHNGDPWSESEALAAARLLPHHFRDSGYHTMMAGKIFHGRTGMENDSADEQGGSMGGQAMRVKADDYPEPFEDLKGIHNYAVHWGGLESEKADELSDPKLAEWASERLRQEHDRPFLLMLGFHRPHTPLTSPKEYWEMFDREKIQIPPLNPSDLVDMPWPGKQVAVAGYQAMENGHFREITERGHHRDVLRGYLAACAFVDAQIGKVLHALDRGPHRDNTIVVLFSDHGWGVGERYHFKKWGLWDDTTRVPYIVHVPGLTEPGSRSDAGVTLLDLYPTLVELTGIEAPPQSFDGRSLRPLLENPDAAWDRPALTTFGQENYALRTPEWRYIRWSNGEEELYDHATDLHEWQNVAAKPENEAVKAGLESWFPKESVPSVASDHASPVTLSPKSTLRHFRSVRPTFVDQPISVKATIGPTINDGVILQHGGQFCGYALYVKDGKLTMAIMDVPRPLYWNRLTPKRTIITADSSLPEGEVIEVEGRLTRDGTITLWANGGKIGSGKAKTLSIHPAGIMQLGQAPPKYVPVGDYEEPFPFKGKIESVTVKFGE